MIQGPDRFAESVEKKRCVMTAELFTTERLQKVSPGAAKFRVGLCDCERWFQIDTPLRAAHFLAQAKVESSDFSEQGLGENMHYSSFVSILSKFGNISEREAADLQTVGKKKAR